MTSYHPASKGMVKRFHRQLKAALRASPDPQSWTEFLLIVLLGCCTAVKTDLGFSSAELLYGTTLALPGTMSVPDTSQHHDPASYVARLRTYFSNLLPMGSQDQSPPSNVPSDIDSWSHVFVRDDSIKGPLVSPYKGPFHVLSRTPKVFTIDMNGRTETVSVDWLKRAHFEVSTSFDNTNATPTFEPTHAPLTTPSPTHAPLTTPSPTHVLLTTPAPTTPSSSLQPALSRPYVTRTGQTVHWPKKLAKTIYI
ncbi:uncharacterized protein LOC106878002 [Octopus bimaculoides]|uniref:uncharacterized protein LOC106878002 n=1 Tax=Octopus bimaculoides TaxID=37653 RepID=UPI00071D9C75|nr:uncharacterized protein LOC106878002 [Octopus bimaculoides]|eukprot:XP_014782566.1 PREDICTED: uncharacterized protein LOC106878002 [Octopus bimaculoides]